MDRYIPTEEELLESLQGYVSADDLLAELQLSSFRDAEDYSVWVLHRGTSECRRATAFETQLHEESVRDYHREEAECGLL
jgi:hypothetical protein